LGKRAIRRNWSPAAIIHYLMSSLVSCSCSRNLVFPHTLPLPLEIPLPLNILIKLRLLPSYAARKVPDNSHGGQNGRNFRSHFAQSDEPRFVLCCQTPILRGIMYFVTCHHSEQELKALKWKLTTCSCNFGDPVIARLHLGDPEASGPNQGRDNIPSPNIDTALASLCAVIAQALQPLPVGNFRKALRNARADAQPWPNNQEDIISSPEGTKGTIAALLRWASAPPSGYGVFLVLGGLARFWDPYGRSYVRRALFHSQRTTSGSRSTTTTHARGS
jgi:hypothetical protein